MTAQQSSQVIICCRSEALLPGLLSLILLGCQGITLHCSVSSGRSWAPPSFQKTVNYFLEDVCILRTSTSKDRPRAEAPHQLCTGQVLGQTCGPNNSFSDSQQQNCTVQLLPRVPGWGLVCCRYVFHQRGFLLSFSASLKYREKLRYFSSASKLLTSISSLGIGPSGAARLQSAAGSGESSRFIQRARNEPERARESPGRAGARSRAGATPASPARHAWGTQAPKSSPPSTDPLQPAPTAHSWGTGAHRPCRRPVRPGRRTAPHSARAPPCCAPPSVESPRYHSDGGSAAQDAAWKAPAAIATGLHPAGPD